MDVVMVLTVKYGVLKSRHAWKMLSKLKIGTKKTGLMHSVVPPTEWSFVRTNTERFFTIVHYKVSLMV